MYICNDCKFEFSNPSIITERHGLDSPPYEKIPVCPYCGSNSFASRTPQYCKFCGAKLGKNQTDFCNDSCKERNRRLLLKEKNAQKLLHESPLYELMRQTEDYNKSHGTNLSYGQYVMLQKTEKQKAKDAKQKEILAAKKKFLSSFLLQQTKINRLKKMYEENLIDQNDFYAQLSECEQKRAAIEDCIYLVRDEKLRELLIQKYICGRTLEEIAIIMNFSKRHIERLHIIALNNLEL